MMFQQGGKEMRKLKIEITRIGRGEFVKRLYSALIPECTVPKVI